jgi:hypothetical protein
MSEEVQGRRPGDLAGFSHRKRHSFPEFSRAEMQFDFVSGKNVISGQHLLLEAKIAAK